MHTELNHRHLGLFLAPKDTDRPPHQAMPVGQAATTSHDFLLLIQLPDFMSGGCDKVEAPAFHQA
jgi:hypothetical protein